MKEKLNSIMEMVNALMEKMNKIKDKESLYAHKKMRRYSKDIESLFLRFRKLSNAADNQTRIDRTNRRRFDRKYKNRLTREGSYE